MVAAGILSLKQLMQNSLYQKLSKRGEVLKQKFEKSADIKDRPAAHKQFLNKLFAYEAYQSSQAIGAMRLSALQMVHVHNVIYGLDKQYMILRENARVLRHGHLFTQRNCFNSGVNASSSSSLTY